MSYAVPIIILNSIMMAVNGFVGSKALAGFVLVNCGVVGIAILIDHRQGRKAK